MSALLAILLAAGAAGRGPGSYEASRRAAYLEAALAAVRAASPALRADGYQFLSAMERGACASSAIRLKVECLMTASRRFCRGREPSCPGLMDVVASNVLAEQSLVNTDRRYEIMKVHRDWRAEVMREIRRMQGALAVDFHLHQDASAPAAFLGQRIDAYCVATADKSNLPYQTCASSLVWFIGTSGAPPAPAPNENLVAPSVPSAPKDEGATAQGG